jgi:hypothetical protein
MTLKSELMDFKKGVVDTAWGVFGFGVLFFVLLLFLLPIGYLWYDWFPVSWYAITNGTDSAHVTIQSPPHDCAFSKAPLGDKGCHYEKQVVTQPDRQTGKVSVYVYWNKVVDGN